MKKTMIAGAMISLAALAAAKAQFQIVDLSSFYNADKRQSCCEGPQYPLGDAEYLGIPFYLGPATGNNFVFFNDVGSGLVTREIPVNRNNVQLVRTLMNTAWGQGGPNSYLRIEFHGTDGTVYGIDLVGGVHIRDHGPGFTQNFENNPPTCTRNVWLSTGGTVKADMQTFALPAAIRQNGLAFIRLIDTGGSNFQRCMVFAITLDTRICEANINDDCQVDFFDYLDFVQLFSTNNPEADFNGDGAIDFFDYLDFVQAFSQGC